MCITYTCLLPCYTGIIVTLYIKLTCWVTFAPCSYSSSPSASVLTSPSDITNQNMTLVTGVAGSSTHTKQSRTNHKGAVVRNRQLSAKNDCITLYRDYNYSDMQIIILYPISNYPPYLRIPALLQSMFPLSHCLGSHNSWWWFLGGRSLGHMSM